MEQERWEESAKRREEKRREEKRRGEERRREDERRSEKRKGQRKEDAGARKGRKVATDWCLSNALWLRRVEK